MFKTSLFILNTGMFLLSCNHKTETDHQIYYSSCPTIMLSMPLAVITVDRQISPGHIISINWPARGCVSISVLSPIPIVYPDEMHTVYNNPEYEDIILTLKRELRELKEKYDDQDCKYSELVKINREYY